MSGYRVALYRQRTETVTLSSYAS